MIKLQELCFQEIVARVSGAKSWRIIGTKKPTKYKNILLPEYFGTGLEAEQYRAEVNLEKLDDFRPFELVELLGQPSGTYRCAPFSGLRYDFLANPNRVDSTFVRVRSKLPSQR